VGILPTGGGNVIRGMHLIGYSMAPRRAS
jgi:hypothetical protein